MTNGIAVHVFTKESKEPVFRLYPSLGMDEDTKQFVVSKSVTDGAQPYETLVACNATGSSAQYLDAEALTPRLRIVGQGDVRQALNNLGYIVVDKAHLDELQTIGVTGALTWYQANILGPGAQEYADNNWGLFAAQHLVTQQKALRPLKRQNSVSWRAHEKEQETKNKRERAAYRDYLFG